ncbi:hypothetical protein MBLNU459_g6770t1 [Dothideomycetes sp. NU459]
MADIYSSFLRAPTAAALAPNASLYYITTTTAINEPATIIKHLQAQEKQVKKKSETVLSAVESRNAVVLETETTFEFIRGGGTILPQMDDNMLSDIIVVCPMIHVVQLDNSGKISQIRLHWDQGTMLRQVEAIGKSGRNWPIRDGTAMVRMVKDSIRAAGDDPLPTRGPAQQPQPSNTDEVVITSRPQSSKTNDSSDFHSRLFATGSGDEPRSPSSSTDRPVATRVSAKPAPRQWGDLFASGDTLATPAPNRNARSSSPAKAEGAILKAGAGKNFGENRLFDTREGAEREPSQERRKVDGSKSGQSFVLGHGEDAPPLDGNRPLSAKAKKQMNKWDFEDFVTPEKIAQRPQPEHERHIGPGIDEDDVSPEKRPIVHAPRPDADTHFKMTDDHSPAAERNFKNIRADALQNHCDSGTAGYSSTGNKQPLGTIRNTNNNRRGNDFNNPHFSVNGKSPNTQDENAHDNSRGTTASKDHNEMASNWRMDETPEKPLKIYKTAGNGIGGRKGAESLWDMNPEEAPVKAPKIYKTAGNGIGGRKGAESLWDMNPEEDGPVKEAAIYRTYGNGMGGRRDQQLGYDIAESDDTQSADARNSAFSSAPKSRNKAYAQFQPSQTTEDTEF